jgi:hypothetical protein
MYYDSDVAVNEAPGGPSIAEEVLTMTRFLWVAWLLFFVPACAAPVHLIRTPGAPVLPESSSLDVVHAAAPPGVHGPELARVEGEIAKACGWRDCREEDCDDVLRVNAKAVRGAALVVVLPMQDRPYGRHFCSGVVYGGAP